MYSGTCPLLFAVHISDGFLTPSWIIGGFLVSGLLAFLALTIDWGLGKYFDRTLKESEIANIALLTAAFYVASLIHVRIGPTTVHLLLNGLLGVVLGWRAALAIPVGLFFQAAFFGHGGFTTVGINSCVMVIPALAAWGIFAGMHHLPCIHRSWFRGILVTACVFLWSQCLVFSCVLFFTNSIFDLSEIDPSGAWSFSTQPTVLLVSFLAGILFSYLEPKMENGPEFPLGLFVGLITVLMTMGLNFLVLVYGGEENWRSVALVTFVAHLPIAVLEGLNLGGVVCFLAKVKPELLGWK